MSEALLGEQMERMAGQAERATEKAAEARAELAQAMDLLTALGVARTTKPETEARSRGLIDHMMHSTPRTLTLTERIMALDRRNPSVMFVGGGGGVGEASGGMGGDDPDDGDDPDATKPETFTVDLAAGPGPGLPDSKEYPVSGEPDSGAAGPGAITGRSGLHVPDPVTPVPGQRLEVPDDESAGAAAASEPEGGS